MKDHFVQFMKNFIMEKTTVKESLPLLCHQERKKNGGTCSCSGSDSYQMQISVPIKCKAG